MKIYFERIRFYHYPIVKYFVSRGHKVTIFNFFDQKARRIKWLRDMLDSGKVSKISHVVPGSDKFVVKSIEKVSDFYFKNSLIVKSISRLHKNDNLSLAYKKEFSKRLSHFYGMQMILNREEASEEKDILFFPKTYLDIFFLLKSSGAYMFDFPRVRIPVLFRFICATENFFFKIFSLLQSFFVGLVVIFAIVYKMILGFQNKKISSYTYAIPITNPKFQFKFNEYRTFGFLLDDKNITKSNVVFLAFVPIDEILMIELRSKGYNILDYSRKSMFFCHTLVFNRNNFKVLIAVIRHSFVNLFSSFAESLDVVSISTRLLYSFLQWTVILDNIHFSHHIALNEEDFRHIGRNALLSNKGIQSWCYAYSSAYGYTHTGKDIPAEEMLHWMWFFLMYDHFVAWNREVVNFHQLHPQEIGTYHNIGCLWSEFVMQGQNKIGLSDFFVKYKIENKCYHNNYKVVSFLDTSYIDSVSSRYPLKDGVKFYSDIEKLLNEEKDIFVIIKEKKMRDCYSDISGFLYSKHHKLFFDSMDRLSKHPRCYVPKHTADPTDIIKVSDLTVSYAFSSSAIEALGARKKAIFYDPAGRLNGLFYDQIPNLVAHGYEELKDLVRKLLYETSDDEYEKYLDSDMLKKVDDYFDGKGLTRFRNLLLQKRA
ncbi:MAG: polysaccharide biosynthesis PFTS motif protein [Candidatus Zapsychrus exili]|nr:polysaccharide biosynthesis PFTS motif protein [Candidatus Zapsychrus exili]